VPSYKEFNPAVFTTVTFPFLFGVMFGDIGHGMLLLVFSLYLVCFGSPKGTFSDLHKARYLLLLMGFFSTFCGLIYNDCFSLPLNLFQSCYSFETGVKILPNCVYPAGIDPIWYIST
jgi:V-type H+-transporting ATPase subunit a